MTYVLAAQLLPIALFPASSEAVVERLGARRTMLVCDGARVTLLAALPALHDPAPSASRSCSLVFLLGCSTAPYFAAQRVILPELVGEDAAKIGQANGLIEGWHRDRRARRPCASRAR